MIKPGYRKPKDLFKNDRLRKTERIYATVFILAILVALMVWGIIKNI